MDGRVLYTVTSPPARLLEQLRERHDKQIMSLEIVAILLAVATFAELLNGRRVVLYSDNAGAENSTIRGSAKAFDHNHMIHEVA